MRNIHILIILAFFPVLLSAQYNMANLSLPSSAELSPAKHDHLRLYFIRASDTFLKTHAKLGDYTPLSQALEQKKVLITETEVAPSVNSISNTSDTVQSSGGWVSDLRNAYFQTNESQNVQVRASNSYVGGSSAQVNKLFIENSSNDTVYIMAGELVKGGKQDRVLAQDMVLPPKSGKVDVSVFCVEPHRWTAEGDEVDGAPVFNGYGYASSGNVRKAAVTEKEQGRVWEEVKVVTDANGSATATGTYNAIQNNAEYKSKLDGYISSMKASGWHDSRIVGMVAVTGNRVIACDIFATHALFEDAFPALIHSYSTEAITNGAPVTFTESQVNSYLAGFLSDESQQSKKLEGKGMLYRKNDVTLHLSSF